MTSWHPHYRRGECMNQGEEGLHGGWISERDLQVQE